MAKKHGTLLMDVPRGIFEIIPLSTFIHLCKYFFLKFHAGLKKCQFANFSEGAVMAVFCYSGPKQSLTGIEKLFRFRVPINLLEGKTRKDPFFKVQFGKITV